MTESLTLIPCPFCDTSRMHVQEIDGDGGKSFVVRCGWCRADGPLAGDSVTAQQLWNKRPHDRGR